MLRPIPKLSCLTIFEKRRRLEKNDQKVLRETSLCLYDMFIKIDVL